MRKTREIFLGTSFSYPSNKEGFLELHWFFVRIKAQYSTEKVEKWKQKKGKMEVKEDELKNKK